MKEKLKTINNLIIAEKFEDALQIAEEIELWKEAGRIRKMIRDHRLSIMS